MSLVSTPTYDQHPPDREYGPTVLIVDDEPAARENLLLKVREVEGGEHLHVLQAVDGSSALQIISGQSIHVVLLDKILKASATSEEENGIDLIPELLQLQPHLQILMVTGSNDAQDVVRAIELGACGYIVKGTRGDLLVKYIQRAVEVAELVIGKIRRDRIASKKNGVLGGSSKVFSEILVQARLLSESNRPVLLLGETGTGKTELANWINTTRAEYLKQKDRPFVAINVSTLSPTLVESELFGHEKGSFTGALTAKQGFFELANNGTLFLDEIGELSLEVQTKLLTVIEEGTFFRVGGSRQMKASPKLIFATNKNLEEMVAQGRFRKDLYMRISMFPIRLPTLAERVEDIPEIVRALLPAVCDRVGRLVAYGELPQDFIEELIDSALVIEGNIRGIRNQLERLLVLCPRDEAGKIKWARWRNVDGLILKKSPKRANELSSEQKPMSYSEIRERPFGLLGPEFPGIDALWDLVTAKVIEEGTRGGLENESIAALLKKSVSWIYRRRSELDERIPGLRIVQSNGQAEGRKAIQ